MTSACHIKTAQCR